MPEGDTLFRAARTLNRALAGKVVTRFDTAFPRLLRVHEDTPITGRTVERVEARGKWCLMHFSGDLILLTHLLMNGLWHIYRTGERWFRPERDMRVLVATADFVAVAFTIQIAEFHTPGSLSRRDGFRDLGLDLLSPEFDARAAAAMVASRPELELAEALLNQHVLAGAGNVFKSEICFACGISPFRTVGNMLPHEIANVVDVARKFLLANVTDKSGDGIVTYTGHRRTTRRANPTENLFVYGRRGLPCRRCGAAILSRKQGPAARITYWCDACQK